MQHQGPVAQERLLAALRQRGVPEDVAQACAKLFNSEAEALEHVGTATDAGNGFKQPWKEYYSLRWCRMYYCNDLTGANVWDMPKPLQLQQWVLDAGLFQVDVAVARALFRRVYQLLEAHWSVPDLLWEGVQLLARLVGNVAQCSNLEPKYRQIKRDNPKLRDKVLALTGAEEVLEAAGFVRSREAFVYPDAVTPLMLSATSLVASRLQTLVDHKGLTGAAMEADDPAKAGTTKQGKWHGTPGFRYQEEIFECSLCQAPINDGSERLFTRAYDAPHGEFRYECQQCLGEAGGSGFHLCEKCWDRLNAPGGASLHLPGHTFRTHHPRTSRHRGQSQESDSNPWGMPVSGASAARGRERLRERTGM